MNGLYVIHVMHGFVNICHTCQKQFRHSLFHISLHMFHIFMIVNFKYLNNKNKAHKHMFCQHIYLHSIVSIILGCLHTNNAFILRLGCGREEGLAALGRGEGPAALGRGEGMVALGRGKGLVVLGRKKA